MNTFLFSLILILAGGVLPLLLKANFKLMKSAAILLIGCGCLLGLYGALNLLYRPEAVSAAWPLLHTFTLSLKIDRLSAFFLLPVFIVSPLAALYSYNYLENPALSLRVAVNYFFYALLTAAMALVACADNIITFALAWELMSLSSFFLVIYDFKKTAARQAGYLYFIFAQAGAMAIFASFALLYNYTGSMDFAAFASTPETAKSLIFTLAFIGFGSKAGIIPLHVWLPHAHPAAPSHVSAIMSGVMIKMGIYGIIRMYSLLHPQGAYCAELVIIVGAVTGVMGVVYALGQHNLKRLLAYHSVENIGIILLGLGIGMLGIATGNEIMAALGFAGGLLHILNHAIFKSLLFMGAGAVQHRTGTLVIERLGGLMKRMRLCGITFLIGSLAICGLPPFNGFISEFLIYNGAFQGVKSPPDLFLFVILTILSLAVIGGLAIACFTKVVGIVFLGEARSEAAAQARPAGPAIQAAMIILAVFCVVIGLLPQVIMPVVMPAAISILPHQIIPRGLDMSGMAGNLSFGAVGFSLIVLIIIGLRKLFTGPAPYAPTWGCGFSQRNPRMQYTGSSFAASLLDFYKPFVKVDEKFSGIHGFFPQKAEYHSETQDISEVGLQRLIVQPIMRLTDRLRWLQHGHIQLYIGYIFFALVGLLCWLLLWGL
ncbi:MAG: hydrogenase [Deltaproteobacteria bacterium]|nr:hydrogenase [Deltaproteobacteria bacterium]